MFDKGSRTFPIKRRYVYLSHCAIAPLYREAVRAIHRVCKMQMYRGTDLLHSYHEVLARLKQAAATLLRTESANLAFVKNTSEGLGLIAGSYPFQKGDRVICYRYE